MIDVNKLPMLDIEVGVVGSHQSTPVLSAEKIIEVILGITLP